MEDFGFEDKQYEKVEVFESKNVDIPKFHKLEKIKKIAFSSQCVIIYSDSGKIFRWKQKEFSCFDYALPDIKDETSFLVNPANMIFNVIKKLPYGEDKKQSLVIDRITMDPTGLLPPKRIN